VLTRLMQGDAEGRLSERELLHNCIFLLNAGHETTTNLIGNGADALLTQRDELARLVAEPALINTAVEELLRFESPMQLNNRLATAPIELRGRTLPAGCFVTLASARPTATRPSSTIPSAGHRAQAQQPPRLRPGRARLLGHERGAAGRPHRDTGRALQALHAITQRFSAEFAIRPFIVHDPDTVFATLQRWTVDPSAHVRRLVSEGSRPRLPWGIRLQALVADPSPTLPLLAALQDDASDYVRRSVANHLNDIAKDHPAVVVDWVSHHRPGASSARLALLRHASRGLVKAGHAGMLSAWGLGRPFQGRATLQAELSRVMLGGELPFALTLQSTSRSTQRLVVDYAVHHVKADGSRRPKVFKGWSVELAPRERRTLHRRHPLKPVTTRRYHAGQHQLDLRINGVVLATADFELEIE
jgi:3-methyladenine DNA glycosylase AlkC